LRFQNQIIAAAAFRSQNGRILTAGFDPMPQPPRKVRVIAGRFRGSKLDVPDLPGLRPTPDRVRETLFNWLAPRIAGARCLDLFAGSGALGIEALSRGAACAVLVERDPGLVKALRATIARLGADGAEVLEGDALAVLAGPARPFDIVFLDPPFDAGLWSTVAARLAAGAWLAPGALVHVEWPVGQEPLLPPDWRIHREGRAGAVNHALYAPA
jgi:16S rRNA (guanine966-N2)-methyltransferase